MKTIRVHVIVLLTLLSSFAFSAEAKIKTLVVTGGHGFDQAPFFKVFSDNPELVLTTAAHSSKTNASVYDRDDLLDFDVVVLYDMPQAMSDAQKAKFTALFNQGVGLVVLHHALVSYQDWPQYEQIIGGRYPEPDPSKPGKVTDTVGWQHDVDIPVVVAATNHPITAGLSDFTIRDEIYWGFRVGGDVMPLLTTTHPKSGKPLAWARTQGKSRVVFIALGHGREAFENHNYRKFVAQSIRWVAKGRSATRTVTPVPRVFLLDGKKLVAARQRTEAGDREFEPALKELVTDADQLLKAKPASVMDKKTTPPSGDKHDYLSQAPYFWPDPNQPKGLPYIRRDGQRNPEINRIPDHGNILSMPDKVQTLALAFFFTGEERYAAKAAEFLRVWFLEPATRMHPHFQYAQFIPGVNTGRGIGLIESRGLVHVVDSVGLLAGAKAWTQPDQQALETWFAAFLQWMLESEYGRDEAAGRNNHGTYYDLQVSSFALFLGRTEFPKQVLEAAKHKRIAVQIEPDGRQPLELARTKAWSYSTGNLSGLTSLAELGERSGVDLWSYETEDGRGIRRAFDYLLPFAEGEKTWPHQQLGGGAGKGFGSLFRKGAAHFPEARPGKRSSELSRIDASSRERLLQ